MLKTGGNRCLSLMRLITEPCSMISMQPCGSPPGHPYPYNGALRFDDYPPHQIVRRTSFQTERFLSARHRGGSP